MDANSLQVLYLVGPAIVAGAAAWGGSKAALNGTRERVSRLDIRFEDHLKEDFDVHTKMLVGLERMDQKLDSFIEYTKDYDSRQK